MRSQWHGKVMRFEFQVGSVEVLFSKEFFYPLLVSQNNILRQPEHDFPSNSVYLPNQRRAAFRRWQSVASAKSLQEVAMSMMGRWLAAHITRRLQVLVDTSKERFHQTQIWTPISNVTSFCCSFWFCRLRSCGGANLL